MCMYLFLMLVVSIKILKAIKSLQRALLWGIPPKKEVGFDGMGQSLETVRKNMVEMVRRKR
jgi:hypothetical protein